MKRLCLALICTMALPLMAAGPGLSRAEVKRWMETRIETYRLQETFRANASQYDDVPVAFFRARDAYLERVGYSRKTFEDHETRIYNAVDALEGKGKLADEQARRDQELAEAQAKPDPMADPEFRKTVEELRAVGLPEDQIQKMIEAQRKMPAMLAEMDAALDEQEARVLDLSRPDWEGVRPWMEKFNQLQDWMAGNRSQPPAL